MATNNIKIFDQNKANMLTDEAYNTSAQRLNGVQQGIASSQLQNKTLYQVSLVAYAIGQMMQNNGLNANDADTVSTFAGNLSSTIVQKILDKADATEAKNFTVNNKFITPQTWKAAYDFMKADSDMVTSAVDDTHYITPKLLKEGANLFGGKVELEDGIIAKWKTFNKALVNKCNIDTDKFAAGLNLDCIVPDKLKRYYICSARQNYQIYIFLFDYNTNALLDSIANNFTYEGNKFQLNTNYTYISGLSENCFLFSAVNNSSFALNWFAVDFSTGKFVIKNSFNTGRNGQQYNSNIDRTKYYDSGIYVVDWIGGSSYSYTRILKYNTATNTFTNYNYSQIYDAVVIGLDANNEFFAIAGIYSSRKFDLRLLRIKNDAIVEHILGINTPGFYNAIYCRGNFIYLYYYSEENVYTFSKINTTTNQITQLQTSLKVPINHELFLMIVNEDETAFCLNGSIVGSGAKDMKLTVNEDAAIKISTHNDSYLSSSLAKRVMKYKNELVCSENMFVLDPEYAYFGAPVAEIPEST